MPMIGDVNLFFKGSPQDDDFEVEAEIMIAGTLPCPLQHSKPQKNDGSPHLSASLYLHKWVSPEPAYRRKGLASHALQLLLSYATSPASPSPLPVNPQSLVARIGDKNAASIGLFQKLGFVVTKHVKVFEELEMRLGSDNDAAVECWLKGDIVPFH